MPKAPEKKSKKENKDTTKDKEAAKKTKRLKIKSGKKAGSAWVMSAE